MDARPGFICPKCFTATGTDSGRTCTNCHYRGDWIQPGETHLYKCPNRIDADQPCACRQLAEQYDEGPKGTKALIVSLETKLNPARFSAASPMWSAIVGFLLGKQYTNPAIADLIVTSDKMLLAQHEGDCGYNNFIGAESDFIRNWNSYLDAAELSPEERGAADNLLKKVKHA